MGNGRGFSVKEIVRATQNVTGKGIKSQICERREGDPAILIADSTKIKEKLGWAPKYNLEQIVESAWKWHEKINVI